MTVYAAASEADSFSLVSGHSFAHETTSGRFDSTLSRGAMLVTNGTSEIFLPFGTALSSAWIHMRIYQESLTSGTYISLRNAAGTETEYRISTDASGFWTVERFKSSSYTSLGTTSAAAIQANTIQDIDIFYTRHVSTGVFQVYRNGVSILSFGAGDADTESAVAMIRFEGLTTNTREMNVSQVIVADESTIGWKLATLSPDGNGAQTAWTNDYTAVDEFSYNSADYIETNSTSQTETYTVSNINAAFSTYNVKAVAVAARVSNDSGSAVNDIQAVVRVGGTDYPSANLSVTKDGSEQSKQNVWNTNPATSAAWDQTAVNALEAGVKSV